MKQSIKELREFDEMIREEIEAGNPFSEYSSYKSYKSTGRKKVNKKEEALRLGELLQKQLEENSFPF
jgi:hypothetical protein